MTHMCAVLYYTYCEYDGLLNSEMTVPFLTPQCQQARQQRARVDCAHERAVRDKR